MDTHTHTLVPPTSLPDTADVKGSFPAPIPPTSNLAGSLSPPRTLMLNSYVLATTQRQPETTPVARVPMSLPNLSPTPHRGQVALRPRETTPQPPLARHLGAARSHSFTTVQDTPARPPMYAGVQQRLEARAANPRTLPGSEPQPTGAQPSPEAGHGHKTGEQDHFIGSEPGR